MFLFISHCIFYVEQFQVRLQDYNRLGGQHCYNSLPLGTAWPLSKKKKKDCEGGHCAEICIYGLLL